MKFIFNREITTLGLRRGGIHGILVWICGMFNVPYMVHLNTRLRGFKEWYFFSGSTGRFEKAKTGFVPWLKNRCLPIEYYVNSAEQVSPKKYMRLDSYPRKKKKVVNDLGAGAFSRSRKHMLFLRDPFNNLASLMEARRNPRYPNSWFTKEIKLFRSNWIAYAREFSGHTNYMAKKICFSYDLWLTSEVYRRQKAEQLRLEFSDKNFGRMPHAGSSFDDFKFNSKAYDMNLTERWKKYQNSKKFNNILFDSTLLSLYEEIFGNLPYSI